MIFVHCQLIFSVLNSGLLFSQLAAATALSAMPAVAEILWFVFDC